MLQRNGKKKLGSFCCWSKDVEGIQSKRWAVNLEPPLHITKIISVSPWHIETMTSFTGWSFMKELILLTAIISVVFESLKFSFPEASVKKPF